MAIKGKTILVVMIALGLNAKAQSVDSVQQLNNKAAWFVGVDGFSALNAVSLIGGFEIKNSRYSISLTHFWNSTRFGVYYDYCVIQKIDFYVGFGGHASFKLDQFDVPKEEYRDSLIRNDIENATSTIAFYPNYGETRLQYFLSIALSKEFKLFKGLHLNCKFMGVYGYNPYYKHGAVSPVGGIQLYYKW